MSSTPFYITLNCHYKVEGDDETEILNNLKKEAKYICSDLYVYFFHQEWWLTGMGGVEWLLRKFELMTPGSKHTGHTDALLATSPTYLLA